MHPTPWFPPSATRQTLLPFEPLPANDVPRRNQVNTITSNVRVLTPQGPPNLPNEIWEKLLSNLGTIALKKFRLVCQQWNAIGTDLLFETFYLNSYEKSWAGLLALSNSPHASKVRSIEWNPLVLYDDCGDVSIWASRYKSMLHGQGHRNTVSFYQAFHHVYRARQALLRTTPLVHAAEALRRLASCRRIVISDDYDFANTCDAEIRAALVSQPHILQHAATWGLRLPCGGDYEYIAANAAELLSLLPQTPTVASLTLSVWKGQLFALLPPTWSVDQDVSVSHVTSMDWRLKIPDRRPMPEGECYDRRALGFAFTYLASHRALGQLSYQVTVSNPNEFQPDCASEEHRGARNSSSSASTASVQEDEDEDEDIFVDPWPGGPTEAIARVLRTRQTLFMIPLANLRDLTLSNICISAKSLLCFLSCQEQLPANSFSIQLQGTVILSGIDPNLFFDSLALLNVQIAYHADTTFYYPPEKWQSPNTYDAAPLPTTFFEYRPSRGRRLADFGRGTSWEPIYDEAPAQMPTCPSIASQLSRVGKMNMRMRHRAHQDPISEEQRAITPLEELLAIQYYRLRISEEHTIWEWVPYDAVTDPQTKQPWENTFVLQRLVTDTVSEHYDDHEEYEDLMLWDQQLLYAAENEDPEAQTQQVLLRQYETEFLATDIIERYVETIAKESPDNELEGPSAGW